MSAIYRYEVPVDDLRHSIKLFGEIVHVASRDPRKVEFWAEHSDGETDGIERTFIVVGTGHQLPYDIIRVIGSALAAEGALVWHLIEVPS